MQHWGDRQQLIWHFWASGKKAGKSATSKVTVRNSSSSKSWEEHLQKQQQQLLQMSTIIATSTPQLLYHAHQIFKKAKTAAAAFESPRVTRLPLGDASLSKKSTQSTITKSQMREKKEAVCWRMVTITTSATSSSTKIYGCQSDAQDWREKGEQNGTKALS